MISFKQIRNFFITIGLAIMLAITIAFDFGTSDSWAATSFQPISGEPQTQIATTKGIEDQVQDVVQDVKESVGIMTGSGDSPAQSAAKTEKFNAKTLEAMDKSIENPNYQPGGKTKKAEKQDSKAKKDIKAEAGEAMDSYQ